MDMDGDDVREVLQWLLTIRGYWKWFKEWRKNQKEKDEGGGKS